MIKKCLGCGVALQDKEEKKVGFTKSLEMDYCMRCFRIQNYHDISNAYIEIPASVVLKKINSLNGFSFFFIDFLNLHQEAIDYFKGINMPKMLVISKLDTIPKSVYIERIKTWLKKDYHIDNKIIFVKRNSGASTKKLLEEINKIKAKNIFFVGITNAGKSTMLESILNNFDVNKNKITISELPNTTLDFIKIPLENDKVLIDTPGLNYKSIMLDYDLLKKANVKKEIKPITYQLKNDASLILERKIRISFNKSCSITWFGSENIKIEKVYQKNTCLLDQFKIEYEVLKNTNIYLKGIGFFYVKEPLVITMYGIEKEYISVLPSFLRGKSNNDKN